MNRSQIRLIWFAVVALGLLLLPDAGPAQEAQAPRGPVKIGLVNSMFRDVPTSLVQVFAPPFQNYMRDQTGLEGQVIVAGDADDLGKQLEDNQMQLGVFYGFEFAWARRKYPNLKPFVVAVARQRTIRAYLVVRNDNPATALGDLKDKALSIPKRSREYCLLFLDRELSKMGTDQQSFFSNVVHHANMEDALDDVLRDKVQAALVDGIALSSYEQVKPGCFARIKVLAQSEPFPPGIVAYREGSLDNATLTKFKDGLISANHSARGKDLLALWKLAAFENVPADLNQSLEYILKIYPPPAAKGKQ
jgi:ABC-type phosphate/phosphonate transport system substrate-binding protein